MSSDCAVLILSSKAPQGLGALAKYFSQLSWDVFVHVDARIDEEPFRLAAAPQNSCLVFLPNRIQVFWRGFTMVEATMRLLHAALEKGRYKRYMLISDDSLPLIEPASLAHSLSNSIEFTDIRPTTHFQFRYEKFFMLDSGATSCRWVPLEDKEFTPEVLNRILRLQAARLHGKTPLETLFHGSQWWCLTDRAIGLVLESWNHDLWLRESFEFSEVPDEHYFQTVIGSKMRIEPRWFMHTDWSEMEKPKIYTAPEQVRGLRETGALFFRKAQFTQNLLDDYVHELTC